MDRRFGRIDSVKILSKRSADGGQAAFVDFVDIRCAIKAHETPNRLGDRELRTDYNEPASSTLTRSHDDLGRRYDRGGRGPGDEGYGGRQGDGYSGSYGYKDGPPRRDYDRGDPDERSSSRMIDENPESFRRVARNPPKRKESESVQSGSAGSDSGSDSSGSGDSDSDSESESTTSETPRNVKKPIALQIRNLSARSNDTTIRGGLYHEFKKHGDVGQIKVFGRDSNRYAIVYFRRPDDLVKAMESCQRKMFLGFEMDISLYEGDEQEERSFHRYKRRGDNGGPGFNSADDVYQFNATRTIFVGNIERNTNSTELKRMFERYGEIVDIDIKKQGTNAAYAFIQYLDITHAVEAKKQMNRTLAGRNRLKIGFGKGMPTSTVWVGGLAPNVTEDMLDRHFTRYGRIKGLGLDRKRGYCMVSFEHIAGSTSAHNDLKERNLFGKRVRIDYASRESQIFFYDYLVSTGQSEGRRYEPSPPPPMRPRGKMYDEPMRPRHGMRPGPKYHPYDHGYDRPPFVDRGPRPYDEYFRGGSGGYDSDDFGQELREYSRERARDREPDRRPEPPPPRRRHHRGHPADMDSDNERYYGRPEHPDVWPGDGGRERGSPDMDPREDGHTRRYKEGDKRRDMVKDRVQERRVDDKRPPVRIRYDSEEEIENAEPPPPAEKKERNRDKSLRKKPIDARNEDENPEFYPTGYDKTYDEGKIKSVVAKRKVKSKDGTSAEEEKVPPEEVPLPPEEDTLIRKEERSADKASKKLKKEAKKKRKNKKTPENMPPGEEPSKSNPPEPIDFDTNEKKYDHDAQESRVDNSRVSPERARRARKSDVVMKSVVVERPRSPTPEEHLTARKRVHSPERDVVYTRMDDMHRVDYTRDDRVDHTRGVKGSGHHDNDNRYEEVKTKKQRPSTEAPPPPPPPPPYNQNGSSDSAFQNSAAPRNAFVPTSSPTVEPSVPSRNTFQQHSTEANPSATSSGNGKPPKPTSGHPSPTTSPPAAQSGSGVVPNSDDTLMELLRRHPVMWQGLLGLKNDSAAIQMHYVSGNSKLAEYSLPKATGATGPNGVTLPPILRIAQRMRMEISQLEGVTKRMQFDNEHCLLLALPCGRDPLDVHAQTRALKTGFIAYLQQKQAAGIINISQPGSQQASFVLHVFPPCEFTHSHLSRVAPNLLDSATDSGHLMVVVATV
ncbi:msx2-interacting protein-like isoform X2 [Dendronephthya gigantea]|uniref:msx2-interacting protein-like isoform X2 n=1 Tax=Dendronephthya gigantea TaxID=151771 RepID=UPI00106CCF18|nr:msx2-interacting protein-like isoform X2 [Dendronephthya gigantea]